MKKTAVLLDLGFVLHKLHRRLGNRHATAVEVRSFAEKCIVSQTEELFRIYCYHCAPYGGTQTHPLTKIHQDFSQTTTFVAMNQFLDNLKLCENVAYRSGTLSFDGWAIKPKSANEIIKTSRALVADDFKPELKQKGVDMKVGLDVAWLASKRLVDRIVLVTADSDFVPAMKFARREGIQIALVTMDHMHVKREMKEHADFLRSVAFP